MTASDLASLPTDSPTGFLRELEPADLGGLEALLSGAPDAHCVVAEKLLGGHVSSPGWGGQFLGWFKSGELVCAVYVGGNIIPIDTTAAARAGIARRLRTRARRSSAIVGTRGEVLDLARRIGSAWPRPREIRPDQPLLVIAKGPCVAADQEVRRLGPEHLDAVFPAAVAMFTEEIGVSPVAGRRSEGYRARILQQLRAGRVYGRLVGGEVIFKAEVAAASAISCQIQGVWMAPSLRGAGMAAPALASVVASARSDHAPRVSLYANSHNVAAMRTYARVGFEQIGTFATVLY